MKRIFLIILFSNIFISCFSNEIVTSNKLSIEDFCIHTNNAKFRLGYPLNEFLRMNNIKSNELGPPIDYGWNSIGLDWNGLRFFYIDGDPEKIISSIVFLNSDYKTFRGVSIGDKISKLLIKYDKIEFDKLHLSNLENNISFQKKFFFINHIESEDYINHEEVQIINYSISFDYEISTEKIGKIYINEVFDY